MERSNQHVRLFIACDHVMQNPALAEASLTEDGDLVCDDCLDRLSQNDLGCVSTICEDARNTLLDGLSPVFKDTN